MRHYRCTCGNVLFFENSACLQCGSDVVYDLASDSMVVLDGDTAVQRCRNGVDFAVCNWRVPAGSGSEYCEACALNVTVPDVSFTANLDAWRKVEAAKRRVLYTMSRLRLMPAPKSSDPLRGLAFHFLRPQPGAPVMTGHEDGVITLNIDEAESSEREKMRETLGERYRTLVGHFRHELAHFYWDRFFKGRADDDPILQACREVFGDEREDYDAAIHRHYSGQVAPAAPGEFISTYASMHPWEDWAETWAHYLHMLDGTETARAFGLNSELVPISFTRFPSETVTLPSLLDWPAGEKEEFLNLLHSWAKLAPAMNEVVASLGHPTFYPFVFSEKIIRKFFFVHHVVNDFGRRHPEVVNPETAATPADDASLTQKLLSPSAHAA